MKNRIVPLGTIVRIKDKKEKYIVAGRSVKIDDKKYDYLCLEYPQGYHDDSKFVYINDDQVVSIYFLGDTNY